MPGLEFLPAPLPFFDHLNQSFLLIKFRPDGLAAFQGHFAEFDDLATDDDVNYLEAQLRLAGHDIDFHRYPGTGHWFAEADRPAAYHAAAADLAWERTLAFLHARLDPPG